MSDATGFAAASRTDVQVHPDSLVILAGLKGERNLALGRQVVDTFNRTVPLADGSVALVGSEWVSGSPNVFGLTFTVDLGVDRAINRVRVLSGETALAQREYFIRGYELDAAASANLQVWRRLADDPANLLLNIDTRKDSTWTRFDEAGQPLPTIGRQVRLRLTRQDRSNWVAIGEIEVYGLGYADEGTIEDGMSFDSPVNVGRIRWQATADEDASFEMRMRADSDVLGTLEWTDLAAQGQGDLFADSEPAIRVEYQALLRNTAPFATPSLRRIEIEYDPVLVAQSVRGQITGPGQINKGESTPLQYQVDVDVQQDDYGIDRLQLRGAAVDVTSIEIDGLRLAEGLDYNWTSDAEASVTHIELSDPIRGTARVDIAADALFLQDRTAIAVDAGSSEQSATDGFLNWQNGRQAEGASWTALASGAPLQLLSPVTVSERPYSPYAGSTLQLEAVVSNVEDGRRITIEMFTLDGRKVRRLAQEGRSRAYTFEWDGRDQDGTVVQPGLYLYEMRVSDSGAARRGTIVVAY